MQKILIISETKNHLTGSIIRNLKERSYESVVLPADMEIINNFNETVAAIIIFVNERLLELPKPLHFLKDRMMMKEVPFFTVGNTEELEELHHIIPPNLIRMEFVRPIAVPVHDIVNRIDQVIKQSCEKKKILVVDDSGIMLRNIKGWFEDRYSVYLANSAAMAIKYLSLNQPDLILLDYEMPIADGKQTFQMIRAETDFANIPIIFLTGKTDKDSVMQAVGLKPEGYLLKSMPPAMIVKAVEDFFVNHKLESL